ncbi:hypothetical protein [Chishuiella sp.]|uniref:hypothetical protein n=1 Tax=Chishuiella sp. TaxID=1969467 RepID=UPI0028B15900|nr:hypothetical protein [Chishuiella sp.]
MEPVSVNAEGGTALEGTPYRANLGDNVKNIINLNAEKNMFSGGGELNLIIIKGLELQQC